MANKRAVLTLIDPNFPIDAAHVLTVSLDDAGNQNEAGCRQRSFHVNQEQKVQKLWRDLGWRSPHRQPVADIMEAPRAVPMMITPWYADRDMGFIPYPVSHVRIERERGEDRRLNRLLGHPLMQSGAPYSAA
jgi:hypothetical protein